MLGWAEALSYSDGEGAAMCGGTLGSCWLCPALLTKEVSADTQVFLWEFVRPDVAA